MKQNVNYMSIHDMELTAKELTPLRDHFNKLGPDQYLSNYVGRDEQITVWCSDPIDGNYFLTDTIVDAMGYHELYVREWISHEYLLEIINDLT